jgi:hypothetical protein
MQAANEVVSEAYKLRASIFFIPTGHQHALVGHKLQNSKNMQAEHSKVELLASAVELVNGTENH